MPDAAGLGSGQVKLPALERPADYVGLCVFDFGDHTSVGYTADEIEVLRRDPRFAGGQAYVVHAVDDDGRLMLRGVSTESLRTEEAMIFGHNAAASARVSYDELKRRAEKNPLPCEVTMELADFASHQPSHVVVLICTALASQAVGAWLSSIGFAGGDVVSGGADVLADYRTAGSVRLATCSLHRREDCVSRNAADVLAGVDRAIQR